MRTPFVAGNWKMNMTVAEAVAFVAEIKEGLNSITAVDSAVCPPFLALPAVAGLLSDTRIGVGAQNMHFESSGAFTGELSPRMIAPFCHYVILGHSERRAMFGETDEGVNQKVKAALAAGLTPIVCVGESLEQNENGETDNIVSGQVAAAFAGISAGEMAGCVVAYEPIWAIGSGKTATVDGAGQVIGESVRATIAHLFDSATADKVRIQYGGSVKPDNIAAFMAHPDIDGALVGGASLKPSFVDLVRNAA